MGSKQATGIIAAPRSKEPPKGWGDDDLTSFIELARQNQWATFANLRGSFARLRDIDAAFLKAAGNLNHSEHWFPAFFLLKAHSSSRAAVQLAMSGQLSESYMTMRGCLENAIYAYRFYSDPKAAEVWARRDEGEEAKKKVRDQFRVRSMLDRLEADRPRIGKIVRSLYERTIDYGAHPNSLDLFTNLKLNESEEETEFQVVYLCGDSPPKRLALKSAAQVGVAALSVFAEIFGTRFALLGLGAAIKRLSKGL